MIRCSALVLLLSVVTASAYGRLASRRRAKMPDFASSNVLDDYINRRSQVHRVSSQGFRRFPTVNHLKVKTNSSTHANEPNVTLKLNIPASISGFTLDQIDLKYVKKNRFQKSSRARKSSNLFIKYLTNKSSDLHLSSVRRQDGNYRPDPSLEPKESRNEIFDQDSYENQLMRFENKYPFSLRDKSQRIGKSFDGEGSEEDVKEASAEIDENDLKALETILTQKTITYPIDSDEPQTKIDDLDLKKTFEIFKTIPTESKIEDESTSIENISPLEIIEKAQPNRKQFKSSKSNWFSDNVSNYLSSVIPSLQSSFFK